MNAAVHGAGIGQKGAVLGVLVEVAVGGMPGHPQGAVGVVECQRREVSLLCGERAQQRAAETIGQVKSALS